VAVARDAYCKTFFVGELKMLGNKQNRLNIFMLLMTVAVGLMVCPARVSEVKSGWQGMTARELVFMMIVHVP
jgi:hypothetical protein